MSYYDIGSIETNFGKLAVSRKINKGTILFRQNQKVDNIYFIDAGRVMVESYTESEGSLVLYFATEGMALAEEHIFMERYGYSAVAEEDLKVRLLDKTVLLEHLQSNPAYATQFMKCISSRYNELRVICTLLTIRRAEVRLLAYLKWRTIQDGSAINLQGRIGQLGIMLNLTRESIYRAMACLEEQGKLVRQDGVVTVQ